MGEYLLCHIKEKIYNVWKEGSEDNIWSEKERRNKRQDVTA
jgi:hypothetical protein